MEWVLVCSKCKTSEIVIYFLWVVELFLTYEMWITTLFVDYVNLLITLNSRKHACPKRTIGVTFCTYLGMYSTLCQWLTWVSYNLGCFSKILKTSCRLSWEHCQWSWTSGTWHWSYREQIQVHSKGIFEYSTAVCDAVVCTFTVSQFA